MSHPATDRLGPDVEVGGDLGDGQITATGELKQLEK